MATLDVGSMLRQVYEAWNAKDLDRAMSFATNDARMTIVQFSMTEGLREYMEGWARAFPDGRIEVNNLVAQGESVVAEFTGRGTHTGILRTPSGDLSPTGRRVEMPFVEIYRFRNGKIGEGRIYFDTATMMAQLGQGAAVATGAGATATAGAGVSQPRH